MKLLSVFAGILVLLMLAACDSGATPTAITGGSQTPSGDQPTQADAQPTSTRGVTGNSTTSTRKGPIFTFMPRRGGPDTVVSITGGNFTPGQTVSIRVGIPDPIGEPLASATTGDDGRWNTSFKIPGTEPSGKAITTQDLKIVVMDQDNKVLATETFKFIPK